MKLYIVMRKMGTILERSVRKSHPKLRYGWFDITAEGGFIWFLHNRARRYWFAARRGSRRSRARSNRSAVLDGFLTPVQEESHIDDGLKRY
jgi:hypothetical protein